MGYQRCISHLWRVFPLYALGILTDVVCYQVSPGYAIDFNDLSFLLYSIHPQIRAIWVPVAKNCLLTNLEIAKPSLISLFATDALLLLIMLAGLLRIRPVGDTFKLWRLLWTQVGWRFSLA
jgi:hypothetical protein